MFESVRNCPTPAAYDVIGSPDGSYDATIAERGIVSIDVAEDAIATGLARQARSLLSGAVCPARCS